VIQKADVYTSRPGASALALAARPEFDYFYVVNVDGLDPVKISVGTASLGAIDGETHIGNAVPSRNIVLTLRPNTNYVTWSSEEFRRFIYTYFTPKSTVRLVFTTDELAHPVEISGIVESVTDNPFAPELEFQVSVICPDPYFQSTVAEVIPGTADDPSSTTFVTITNPGDLPSGFFIRVQQSGTDATDVHIQLGNPVFSHFTVLAVPITSDRSLEVSSQRLNKFVRQVAIAAATYRNVFTYVESGSEFPILQSGANYFSLFTDTGDQTWEITYYPRYDGI
jgi:Phage tail protein